MERPRESAQRWTRVEDALELLGTRGLNKDENRVRYGVADVDAALDVNLQDLGPRVQNCGHFPEGVNVSFVEPLSQSQARIRVYERGSGETLACGTGTCAAFIAGRLQGRFGPETMFHARGGDLFCRSRTSLESVMLTGNASVVFEGFFPIYD